MRPALATDVPAIRQRNRTDLVQLEFARLRSQIETARILVVALAVRLDPQDPLRQEAVQWLQAVER